MDKEDKAFLGAYALGGVAALIGIIFQSSRPEVIPGFKASKEFKQKLKRLANSRAWSMSQTAYVAASIGVEVMIEDDQRREREKLKK